MSFLGKLPRKLKKRMLGTRRRPKGGHLRSLCDIEAAAFKVRQESCAEWYGEVAGAVCDMLVFGQIIYKDGKRVSPFAGVDYSKPVELPEACLDAIPWPGGPVIKGMSRDELKKLYPHRREP